MLNYLFSAFAFVVLFGLCAFWMLMTAASIVTLNVGWFFVSATAAALLVNSVQAMAERCGEAYRNM